MRQKIEKIWPFIVSAASASAMLVTFFIPSMQDQWDRYQSRQVIEQYVQLGDGFFAEEKFDMAEQAYDKAFELSNQSRLDIDFLRLRAKVNRMNLHADWGKSSTAGLRVIDFEMLLHLERQKGDKAQQVATLNAYAEFLADKKDLKKAEAVLHQAIALNPNDETAYINLGNISDQQGQAAAAEKYYKEALRHAPQSPVAHYDLGMLYADMGRKAESKRELDLSRDFTKKEDK